MPPLPTRGALAASVTQHNAEQPTGKAENRLE